MDNHFAINIIHRIEFSLGAPAPQNCDGTPISWALVKDGCYGGEVYGVYCTDHILDEYCQCLLGAGAICRVVRYRYCESRSQNPHLKY